MVGKSTAQAAADISPPAAVVVATTIMGVSLQDWVLYLTLLYTAFRAVALIPKLLGCLRCFRMNGACLLKCKSGGQSEG